jgi:hypothetical protein
MAVKSHGCTRSGKSDDLPTRYIAKQVERGTATLNFLDTAFFLGDEKN